MKYDHHTYLQQIGLKSLGYYKGLLDGLNGPETKKAFNNSLKKGIKGPKRPSPNYRSKVSVFGEPGRESALKRVKLPWKMKVVGTSYYRSTVRLHASIADLFIEALKEIQDKKGMEYIKRYGLDLFGGDYVNRKSRGGNSTSDHAWGIAVDLNPEANGLRTQWVPGKMSSNGTSQMPREVVDIFQEYGFQLGFRTSQGTRRDMMHIAYVDRP